VSVVEFGKFEFVVDLCEGLQLTVIAVIAAIITINRFIHLPFLREKMF